MREVKVHPMFMPGDVVYTRENNKGKLLKAEVLETRVFIQEDSRVYSYEVKIQGYSSTYPRQQDQLFSRENAIKLFDEERTARFVALFT